MNIKDLDGFSFELVNATLLMEDYIKNTADHFEGLIGCDAVKIISSGGKRLRPVLLIISYLGNCHDVQFCFPACAAVEFFHSATLVHDDIIDGSIERRGKQTFNYIKGDRYALLIGDYLFASCFKELASYSESNLIRILSNVGIYSCLGEFLQQKQLRTMINTEEYFLRIKNKTGYLFSAACYIGAKLAKKTDLEVEKYSNFGMKMGQAYQIYDDSLDIIGGEAVLGKPPGNDIREGIVTLPVLIALEILNGDRRSSEMIKRIITVKNGSQADFDAAIEILKSSGAVDKAIDYADDLAEEAVDDLKQVAGTKQVGDAKALWSLIRQRIKLQTDDK